MKPIVYLISGLGADYRAYLNMHIDGFESRHIKWISPLRKESLSAYAGRLMEQIDQSQPVILVGTSLGGILATEISKKIKVEKLILISTIKTNSEKPFYFSLFKVLPLYKIIPDFILYNPAIWLAALFGLKIKERWRKLFIDMFNEMPEGYLRWAFDAVLHWNNEQLPSDYIHIHGSDDLIFPVRNITYTHLIPKGTHVMVVTHGREISHIIRDYLGN